MQLFEALEKLMNRDHTEELAQDLAEARKKKKKSRESPKTPPGSPPHQPPPHPLPESPSKGSVRKVVSEVVTDAVDWAMQAPLRNHFRDLPKADMKEILHQCMWETESYKTHEDHMQLFEALEKSMNHDHSDELAQDLAEARKKKKKSRESPKTPSRSPSHQPPPPPPPVDHPELRELLELLDHPKCHHHHLHRHSPIKKVRLKALLHQAHQRQMHIGSAHIPTVNLRQYWWKPFEEELPATPEPAWSIRSSDVPVPMNNWASTLASNYSPPSEDSLLAQTGHIATFIDWFCKRRGITELKPQDLEGLAFEIVKVFHPDVIHLQYQMEKCHKLLTDITIQSDFVFNKDLKYLRYDSKGRRPALSILKMKAAYYPDAGLEQMVSDQFWIEAECKYDIAAMYGISHWWQSAPASDHFNQNALLSLEPRDHPKIISLGNYSIMLASSHTVKTHTPSGQAPAMAPPVRTDDQILPRIRWVPIRKSNCYLDLEKSQCNPIYKIAVDLLKHTNFFRAFTASSTIPSIYIQQFWDTVQYDKKAGCYRFHPRPDSLLHLPNEEPVLGYLKFSAKGTKRDVFGIPIHGSLITIDIQEASYYQEYLENVAKHKRYLVGKTGSDQDSPAPKPTKPARKPKTTTPKAPPRPSVLTLVTSAQPAPTSTLAKPQEKKHEPAKEPQVAAEDTDLQKALEENMKIAYAATPRGPLLPVVIREPESGKYRPLPEVPGKGKAKVTKERVAHNLLSLQKPKRKSPADQYIFQRRVSEPTGSCGHDESPYAVLRQSDNEEESGKVVLGADEGGQDEGQTGQDPSQEGPDPGNAVDDVQSIPSHVVHAGSNCEHMDLDVVDVSPQHSTEQLDEGFTATAYLKVQENLKLTVKEHVLLEEPASSLGTLSSVQHLSKYITFGDLFFSDKPSDADKNAETEVEPMVNVPIQQYMSLISLMTSPIIDLTSRPESPKVHQQFKVTTTDTTTTTTLPPPKAQQQSTAEAMMMKRIDELEHIILMPSISITPADLEIDEDMGFDEQAQSSDDEDIGSAHIPKASALASNYSPHPEDSLLVQTGPAFEIVKVFHPDVIHLQYQMEECYKLLTDSVDDPILRHNVSKPLPLGGPPGQVTIQSYFFFNKDLEYIRYDSKGSKPALSISKMKAAYYPDARLEKMVPDQFWIKEECKYDIASMTHMRILSVVQIEVFSMYGYDYMKRIVLRRADLNEHVITERDFKYMYPSDFEDLYLLNLQGHLNHLPPKDKKILTTTINQWTRHLVIRQCVEDFQLEIESYQTQLNLTKPQWDATGFEYKRDYTNQQDESRFKYEVLDPEGRRSEQGVHVRHSEAIEDKEDLPQPGELC
nr:hypothetical protein [Tanacetum cinerariifolium]